MSDSSQHRVHFFLIPFVCLRPPYTLKGLARFCLTCVNDALFVSHLSGAAPRVLVAALGDQVIQVQGSLA